MSAGPVLTASSDAESPLAKGVNRHLLTAILRTGERALLGLGVHPYRFALVTGCPRSGTTAVIEWLALQPGAVAVAESRVLIAAHRFLQAVDSYYGLLHWRRSLTRSMRIIVSQHYALRRRIWGRLLIEKEPLEPIALPDESFEGFLEHVRALLPGAKLVFMLRHPVPTIWSMRNREWGTSLMPGGPRPYSLEECIRIWRLNAALAVKYREDANAYLCRFEDLVTRTSEESRRLLEFLGLPLRTPFAPQPTKSVAFSEAERAEILEATQSERAALGY